MCIVGGDFVTLMELYNSIKNPLEDDDVIRKIITAYGNSTFSLGGFYGQLTKTVQKEHNDGKYYIDDANKFYSMMFNKWKNSIVSLSNDELYKRGYGQDFIKMKNYLLNISDVSTLKETDDIIFGDKDDKELERALKKYRWDSFGENSGWIHVCSKYLTAKGDQYPNVEHRLYLNTEPFDTYKMITLFAQKCDERHLPYYFKFDEYADRDDTIVVYSSTENLSKYIEIFEEIKKEYPELVSRIKKPPVLTGQIDGFIGYGSEPNRTRDGNLQSFNEVRVNVIEPILSKLFRNYMSDNYNNIKNDMISNFCKVITQKVKEDYFYYIESAKRREKKFGEKFDPNSVYNLYGYNPEYIDSKLFQKKLYEIVLNNIDGMVRNYIDGKHLKDIEIPVLDDKTIDFSIFRVQDFINSYIADLICQSEEYVDQVRNGIKTSIKDTDIDLNKFCFDKHTIMRLEQVDALNSNNYGGDTLRVNVNDSNALYDNKLNEEFLNLLQELKKTSYGRKERSKFVVRVEQIIEIYRSEIHNNEFADTLVKAFNNAQKIYEDKLAKKTSETLDVTERKGKHFASSEPKHFKAVHLEDKPVNLSDNMESKIEDENREESQVISDGVYKSSSQKVEEMLDKKMAEINKRVDNGETLDSKIGDLSKYVNDLNNRRQELNDKFKDVWNTGDEQQFDKLLNEDNKIKDEISKNTSEIERQKEIRAIVDEQIARDEVTHDIEKFENDVNFILNSGISEENKRILIDEIYAQFDDYVEKHPETSHRVR